MHFIHRTIYFAKTACYAVRLCLAIISQYMVWVLVCVAVFDYVFEFGFIRYEWIKELFLKQDAQIQSSIVSSLFTVAGIFLSVYFASVQWRRDVNSKSKIEMSYKITSILYDCCVCIEQILDFVKTAKKVVVWFEYYDSDSCRQNFTILKDKAEQIKDIESKLSGLAHDINKICNTCRAQIVAYGLHSTTVTISTRAHRIANSTKSMVEKLETVSTFDKVDILDSIDLYCVDMLVGFCEASICYYQLYSGMISKKMSENVREYTVDQLLLMIKLIPFVEDYYAASKTGVLKSEWKITRRIVKDKELLEALRLNKR